MTEVAQEALEVVVASRAVTHPATHVEGHITHRLCATDRGMRIGLSHNQLFPRTHCYLHPLL
jgi:hypothetical protein